MRTFTLLMSIVVHATVVFEALIVPIMATHAAPRPLDRIRVVLAEPQLPAAPQVRPVRPAAAVNPNAAPVVEPALLAPEQPVAPRVSPGVDEQIGLLPGTGVVGAPLAAGAGEPPPPPVPQPVPVLRVGGVVRAPEKLHHVNPAYPPIALSARVQGVVILEALIGEDGQVRDLRVLRSTPLLDRAAEDAVKQWRFRPTLLNGQAVPILMTVTVSFTLN